MVGNREYKSDVFSTLLKDRRYALQVYNINRERNGEFLQRCPILREYMIFIDYVRNTEEYENLAEAINRAIECCI